MGYLLIIWYLQRNGWLIGMEVVMKNAVLLVAQSTRRVRTGKIYKKHFSRQVRCGYGQF